jgi:lipid-A-disaccharide synthase
MKSLLVIAGELSGDMHAAGVVRELKARAPDLQVWGIGGDDLRAAGMDIVVEARDMAVLGLWEVLKRYGFLRGVFHRLVRLARERKPDAVLLIDYPGFNLRFAAEMKKLGIKVIYYVCPQVWAWHRSRIPKMARILDRLLVIFPFEVDVFAGTGLRVDYVGHPLVDEARRERAAETGPDLPWRGPRRLAILPGSRRQEIERILPAMIQAAGILQRRDPELSVVVAAASTEMATQIRGRLLGVTGRPLALEVVVGSTRRILREATAALVKSGTSTIEAALMGCPMVVVYRTAGLTYWLGKRLVKVPYLGMANLIAGREAFRELLQDAATPEALAVAVGPLLRETPERAASLEAVAEVTRKLGEGGAAQHAASIVMDELGA